VHRWQQKSLGEFIELKRGYDLPSRDRVPGEFPLVTSSGPTDFISQSKVKGPGVVTGRYGTVGQVFYVQKDFWPLNTALYVRDFRGNNPRFVYYFLHGIDWEKFNDKSGVPGINRNDVHREPVFVPPLDQQKQIVAVLGALDDKIELNRRMNETLEAMAQAIFRDWFVDFGPVRRKLEGATDPVAILGGLMSDPARAAELAGLFPNGLSEDELPVGWSERPVGDLVDIAGGSTPSTADDSLWQPAEHRWATPKDLSNMSDLALFDTGRRISAAGLAKITSGLLPAGTVLLSSRAPIGYLAIAQAPVAINQGFIALKPTANFGGAYLYLWCKVNMEAILANANGSTFQEISKKNFRPITSAVPDDRGVCRAFGEIADPMFARIVSAAAENRALAETRDYLLPRLMSGEVQVGELEAEGA
jgi:type I restriction enzyme S subunit